MRAFLTLIDFKDKNIRDHKEDGQKRSLIRGSSRMLSEKYGGIKKGSNIANKGG